MEEGTPNASKESPGIGSSSKSRLRLKKRRGGRRGEGRQLWIWSLERGKRKEKKGRRTGSQPFVLARRCVWPSPG